MTAPLPAEPTTTEELLALRDKQITQLGDRISVMERDRRQWGKDVRAAAHQAAWDNVLFNVGLYVKGKVTQPLDNLLYWLRNLPAGRPTKNDLGHLAVASGLLTDWLNGLDVTPAGGYIDEVVRLRGALQTQGQRLHAEYGVSTGERCGCPGCELIRAANTAASTEDGES